MGLLSYNGASKKCIFLQLENSCVSHVTHLIQHVSAHWFVVQLTTDVNVHQVLYSTNQRAVSIYFQKTLETYLSSV
jgi:hypothetical protein